MNKLAKFTILFATAVTSSSSTFVSGCSSNQNTPGPKFEEAIRSEKGPMPPEARAEMEKMKQKGNAVQPPSNAPARAMTNAANP